MQHPHQQYVCHERIGEGELLNADEAYDDPNPTWCELDAEVWCFDDSLYVCQMHHHTRHLNHTTQTVASEQEALTPVDPGERRHGERRKP